MSRRVSAAAEMPSPPAARRCRGPTSLPEKGRLVASPLLTWPMRPHRHPGRRAVSTCRGPTLSPPPTAPCLYHFALHSLVFSFYFTSRFLPSPPDVARYVAPLFPPIYITSPSSHLLTSPPTNPIHYYFYSPSLST